ncbi:MAG TPA: NAD(P)-dependent oxidoreductase [Gemmatimonadaceae bacterium]|nr:NAD(P)-dependent oxidoreductase [Gemmatimonadaceae bacterium]
MSETIAFIGLGAMGRPMAENLLRAGYSVRLYNRTSLRAASLSDAGAVVAPTPRQAAAGAAFAITMVSDDNALRAVTLGDDGLLAGLGAGCTHISMSTIAPATARALAAAHDARGAHYLAAPVFGRPEAAAARALIVCLSGSVEARERAEPVLQALGRRVESYGDDPGAANVVKLVGNFLIAAAMESVAEALALCEKAGLARRDVVDLFGTTLFDCPIYKNYGAAIAEEQFEPAGFRLALGLKDMQLVLSAGREELVPMPLASLLRDRLLAQMARGREALDWSALALGAAEDAGLARAE